jgi:hypothetical protein
LCREKRYAVAETAGQAYKVVVDPRAVDQKATERLRKRVKA